MIDYKVKQFLNWKMLTIMGFVSLIFMFILEVIRWHYIGYKPLNIGPFLFSVAVAFVNVICVSIFTFKLVKWLNKQLPWSQPTALLRTTVDAILFSFVTIGWVLFINQLIYYAKSEDLYGSDHVFYLMAVGTLINLILAPIIELMVMYNVQYQTQLQAKQLIHENTKFKYEVLKNQINPHFLFNSISVLSSLISIDPNKAKTYIRSFSLVLRHVLDFRNTNTIKLSEEQAFLNHYLFMLNTRFGEAFETRIELPSSYSDRLILPMVLQLLVENVIKHNKMSKSEPLVVKICAEEKGISVSNQMRLKSSVSSWGLGLENIKMRYETMGHKVNVDKQENKFTVFIPYIEPLCV